MDRKLLKPIYECRCNGRLQTKRFTRLTHTGSVVYYESMKVSFLLFIIRVKRELKRVYRNGCRYNERLNAETALFCFLFFQKKSHFSVYGNASKSQQWKLGRCHVSSALNISFRTSPCCRTYEDWVEAWRKPWGRSAGEKKWCPVVLLLECPAWSHSLFVAQCNQAMATASR